MNLKYDWDWIREYYFRSQQLTRTTLKDISNYFDVPYQTVRRIAAEEDWVLNYAIGSAANSIEPFPSEEHRKRYLALAVPLVHGDHARLDEMMELEDWL